MPKRYDRPEIPLRDVKRYVSVGNWRPTGRAAKEAKSLYRWGTDDLANILLALKPSQYEESVETEYWKPFWGDCLQGDGRDG